MAIFGPLITFTRHACLLILPYVPDSVRPKQDVMYQTTYQVTYQMTYRVTHSDP